MNSKKQYRRIWDKISKNKKITILTHINTDGDTIGSAIALKHLILENFENKEVKISGEAYPPFLSWLEKNNHVTDKFFKESLTIVVDTSTRSRVYDQRVVLSQSIKIDHHHPEGEWLLEVGNDRWPACGQVVYEMALSLKLKINQKAKDALFVAIWTDTEGLKERNVTSKTKKALKAVSQNQEAILKKLETPYSMIKLFEEHAQNIKKENNVGYLLVEKSFNNDWYRQFVRYVFKKSQSDVFIFAIKFKKEIRIGLRSNLKAKIDVSKFASHFGGGGHFSSAGFNVNNFKEAKESIKYIVKEINSAK